MINKKIIGLLLTTSLVLAGCASGKVETQDGMIVSENKSRGGGTTTYTVVVGEQFGNVQKPQEAFKEGEEVEVYFRGSGDKASEIVILGIVKKKEVDK